MHAVISSYIQVLTGCFLNDKGLSFFIYGNKSVISFIYSKLASTHITSSYSDKYLYDNILSNLCYLTAEYLCSSDGICRISQLLDVNVLSSVKHI